MNLVVRAELTKLLRRKLPFGLLGGVLAYMAVTLVMLPVAVRITPEDSGTTAGLGALISAMRAPAGYIFAAQMAVSTATLFVSIMAAIAVGNEYSWGTMALTMSREPRRGRVLAAKLVALVLLSVVMSLAALIMGLVLVAAVQPLLPKDIESASIGGAWPVLTAATWFRGQVALAVWVAVAVMFAVLTRSPAAAAGITVGLTFGESFLSLAPVVRDFLITTNVQALQHVEGISALNASLGPESAIPPAWRALLVLAAWFGVCTATSWWVLRRRDV